MNPHWSCYKNLNYQLDRVLHTELLKNPLCSLDYRTTIANCQNAFAYKKTKWTSESAKGSETKGVYSCVATKPSANKISLEVSTETLVANHELYDRFQSSMLSLGNWSKNLRFYIGQEKFLNENSFIQPVLNYYIKFPKLCCLDYKLGWWFNYMFPKIILTVKYIRIGSNDLI